MVQLARNLSFAAAIAHLKQELGVPEFSPEDALREAVDFYRHQLEQHPEAVNYLHCRGVQDRRLIQQLSIGYAPGGMLCRHMLRLGYPADLLTQSGLIHQGKDTFDRRIVFPCWDRSRPSIYMAAVWAARHPTASFHVPKADSLPGTWSAITTT